MGIINGIPVIIIKLIRTVNYFIGKSRYILPGNSQSGIEGGGPPYLRAAGGVDTSESKENMR